MIFNGPLPPERMRSSQRNYYAFSLLNGLSYMCVGEGMIVLLAVKVNFPDWVVSVLGAMTYVGYTMLPLGRRVCARLGAASSQAFFWVARNVSAIAVALAGLAAYSGARTLGLIMLIGGAFLFYGFRAAGLVMSQPLIGSITDDRSRGRVLGFSTGIFCAASTLSLSLLSLLLRLDSSIWMLTGIMAAGSCTGIGSSRFLRRIDENAILHRSARRPILGELRTALKSSTLRKQVLAVFSVNTAIIMTVSISLLTVKRGYGVSDTGALLFTLIQTVSSIPVSFGSGWVSTTIGPRKTLLIGYAMLLSVSLLWLTAGVTFNPVLVTTIFILQGSSSTIMLNANAHYFLQSFSPDQQVSYSILLQVAASVGAGLFGMSCSALLINYCSASAGAEIISGFQHYFMLTLILLAPGYRLISRLVPLPIDKRHLNTPLWKIVNHIV